MFTACAAVMFSVFTIEAKGGKATPPLSPTMFCVMILVVLYLTVYLFGFIAQAALDANKKTDSGTQKLQNFLSVCKMAENTVKFGPMLAILFVGARVRALQMTNQKGSPQCWAQDAMYLASGAVALQLCVVIAGGA